MASEITVYDMAKYLDFDKELGIHDTQSGTFISKLKLLPIDFKVFFKN